MQITMDVLMMLGGVAVFMFGMKQMSSGLENSTGSSIKKLFKKVNKNNLINYGIGIGVTAVLNSSSATSIMTVGLAHADIVSVKQGSGFILGAKVGTTLTAFIFALSGISSGGFSISNIFASLAFVGVFIIFSTNNEKLNRIAQFLVGFGMLFIGLEVMESAIGGADSTLCIELSKVFQFEIMQNPFLLVILGILFTAIIQSSTAATGVFITFLATGVIKNLDQSLFLIMGANIGTCSDGIMASLTCNNNGKKIALFHLLTSVIGALSFTVILLFLKGPIVSFLEELFPLQPQFSLATYNLIYNSIYTIVLLFFMDPLVMFVSKFFKEKDLKNEDSHVLDESFLKTPTIAFEQAFRQLQEMALMSSLNIKRSFKALVNLDLKESKEIAKTEYQIDELTKTLTNYFIKLSSSTSFTRDEKKIGSMHHVIDDIERLGDYAVLIVKEANYMKENEISFNENSIVELESIFKPIEQLFDLSYETFRKRKTEYFQEIYDLHANIELNIDTVRDNHASRLNEKLLPVEISKSIYSILFYLQRISDHIVNMAFSIKSTTGSKKEALEAITK